MKDLLAIFRRDLKPRDRFIFLTLQILCVLKDLGGVFTLANATDAVLQRGNVTRAFILMGVVMLVGVLIAAWDHWYKEKLVLELRDQLMRACQAKLFLLRLEDQEAMGVGAMMGRFSSDLEKITRWFSKTLPKMIQLVVYLTIALVYSAKRSLSLTLTIMPAIFILMPLLLRLVNKLGLAVEKERIASDDILQKLSEYFHATEFIKTYGLEEAMEDQLEPSLEAKRERDFQASKQRAYANAWSLLVSYLPGILAGLLGGWYLIQGKITAGFLLAFIQMTMGRVAYAFPHFSEYLGATRETIIYARRMEQFLGLPEESPEGMVGDPSYTGPLLEARDLSFAYPQREPVLRGINFKVERGSKVALIGPSGCGKSTVLKLIMGQFQQDYEGSLKFMGIEIRDWSLPELRRQIAPIFQNNRLFAGTVRSNLELVGSPGSVEAVAAKFSFPDDFMEADLGEGGSQISGGQKQRVALARALLKDAQLYLLDEPLASLDHLTEMEVRQEMARALEGKSHLIVEHRLETLADCDQIYVLKDGRVLQQGTHKSLLEDSESFYRDSLRKVQAEEARDRSEDQLFDDLPSLKGAEA